MTAALLDWTGIAFCTPPHVEICQLRPPSGTLTDEHVLDKLVIAADRQAEQLAPDGEEGAPLARQLGLGRRCEFTLNLSVSGPPSSGKDNSSADAATDAHSGSEEGAVRKQGAKEGSWGWKRRRGLPAAVVGDTDAQAAADVGVSSDELWLTAEYPL